MTNPHFCVIVLKDYKITLFFFTYKIVYVNRTINNDEEKKQIKFQSNTMYI